MGAAIFFASRTPPEPVAPRHPLRAALQMWGSWHLDIPPCGSTGAYATDVAIADAFRMMIYLRTDEQRMDWLYAELRPARLSNCRIGDPVYVGTLIEWWLELYEAQRAMLRSSG
jgi:hypothetical protein